MSVNQPTPTGSKVNKQVADAWSAKVGRWIAFELLEVEAADGRVQTQLINPEEGSVVVAVNATGDDAVKTLVARAGDVFIDSAFGQDEIDGPGEVVEVDNKGGDEPRTPHASTQGVNPTDEVKVEKGGKAPEQSNPFSNENRERLEEAEKDAPTTEGERAREEGIENVVAREQAKKQGNAKGTQSRSGGRSLRSRLTGKKG